MRISLDGETLAFNPGLDPKVPQPGDTIYLPCAYDVALRNRLRGEIWQKRAEREYRLDLDGDGNVELLKTHLLRERMNTEREVQGWRGIPFLCVFAESANGSLVRLKTFIWGRDGGNIGDVKLYPLEKDLSLLHVQMASFGATSMGRHSFLLVRGAADQINRLRFMGGSLDRQSTFALTGSAGYGLRFRMSEDKRTILFRKYDSTPVRILTEAEYRLEKDEMGGYAFTLVREERLPLSKVGEKW